MIVFISCVKKKRKRKTIAEKMYISDFFKKQLAYAKQLNPAKIYILSAKYGVLELNDIIEPYEITLNTFSEKDKKIWAYKCYQQLRQKNIDFNEKAVFLAGKNYRKYLITKFTNVETPLKGLKIGEQLKYLKENIK